MKEVYIMSFARTPIGAFSGALSSLTAPQLGGIAIKNAIERAGITPVMVQEVYMGNVISANIGQAPAQQAGFNAGTLDSIPYTTVNKVCASGMKAMMLASYSILTGDNDIVIAGGMESMSNAPYYLDKARSGYRLGHSTLIDGVIKDGLWDPYKDMHMGNAGELCAKEYGFTREQQDAYTIETYARAVAAYKEDGFAKEIVPISVQAGKETVIVNEDEQYKKLKADKLPMLKPVFQKDGTITAANASPLNDGASAVVLMSKEKADALGLKPLARIISFADAQQAPEWFTTAPSKAMPKAIAKAGLAIKDIDFFEINEAFAVVAMANTKLLALDAARVNAFGGAVALGHPIGNSGCRIVGTLETILQAKGGRYGCAGICNGGGGASAMVIENLVK